jgi:hypothetical protein
MSLQVTGKITKILDKQNGTSKDGKEWVKQQFILDNNEKYNNIFCFEVFGEEKVENFNKFNKVGNDVKIEFNVSTNEYKGKYYTSLSAWSVFKADLSDDKLKKVVDVIDGAFPPLNEPLNASEDFQDLPF